MELNERVSKLEVTLKSHGEELKEVKTTLTNIETALKTAVNVVKGGLTVLVIQTLGFAGVADMIKKVMGLG